MKWKRLIAGGLGLCMMGSPAILESISPVLTTFAEESSFSATCGENVIWNLDRETGMLTISGTGEMHTDCNWTYDYFKNEIRTIIVENGVTSIGDDAFYGCSSLTSVAIPDSVTSIGDDAFYGCSSLTSVAIPDSVTSIGYGAFSGCSSLTSVAIPDSVTSIGGAAFRGCSSLTSVAIPDSVTSIGDGAFYGCSSLTSVAIPDSVTNFGDEGISFVVFRGCSNLTSIDVDENNQKYQSIDGVLFSKDGTEFLAYPEGKADITYSFPESISSISVQLISENLTTIKLPGSQHFISIVSSAFSGCPNLRSIEVAEDNTWYKSVDGVLFDEAAFDYYLNDVLIPKGKAILHTYPAGKKDLQYTIPGNVIKVGWHAFRNCASLENVVIPDSVTSIGGCAFYCCSNLANITIKNPDCEIYDSASSISNSYDRESDYHFFTGTIYGYENSTAQVYAEKYGYNFVSLGEATGKIPGDISGDGELSVVDIIQMQRELLSGQALPANCDLNGDGEVDAFDLALLKRQSHSIYFLAIYRQIKLLSFHKWYKIRIFKGIVFTGWVKNDKIGI